MRARRAYMSRDLPACPLQHDTTMDRDRRCLDKLLRDLVRSEARAIEQAPRTRCLIGDDAPPAIALHDVSVHALAMRPRFDLALEGHELAASSGFGATFSALRRIVADCVHDAEHSFHDALLQLRHGIDVVLVLREAARLGELFALIRWCDDWLSARRMLVARVAAQLCWFATAPAPSV